MVEYRDILHKPSVRTLGCENCSNVIRQMGVGGGGGGDASMTQSPPPLTCHNPMLCPKPEPHTSPRESKPSPKDSDLFHGLLQSAIKQIQVHVWNHRHVITTLILSVTIAVNVGDHDDDDEDEEEEGENDIMIVMILMKIKIITMIVMMVEMIVA